MRNSIYIPAEN